MILSQQGTDSHPLPVLRFAAGALKQGTPCAIVVITSVQGGGLRSPGALMAVTQEDAAGYVSNGCVDGDAIFQARRALAAHKVTALRYGDGSPFMDVRLPCGGSLDLLAVPLANGEVIDSAVAALEARRAVSLSFSPRGVFLGDRASLPGQAGDVFTAHYKPPLRLRITGTGAEPVALARLAAAAEAEVLVQSPEEAVVAAVRQLGLPAEPLSTAAKTAIDDAWTACVFLFHDHGLENALIRQALEGDAFYVGAVGSRQTQAARHAALEAEGVAPARLERLRGPIGLIPSMRDASMLAVSILAEVVRDYREAVR